MAPRAAVTPSKRHESRLLTQAAGGRLRRGIKLTRGLELSAIRNVAEVTATAILHRGQLGELLDPVTPSK